MKKALLKIQGATPIEKETQKKINGGLEKSWCLSDCYVFYLCPGGSGDGHPCAVPDGQGGACFGTLQGGLCCI